MADVRRLVRLARDGVPSVTAEAINIAQNPGFEVDASIWSTGAFSINGGATLTRDTGTFDTGVASGKVVTTNSAAFQGACLPCAGYTFLQGLPYTVRIRLRGNAGGEVVQVTLGNTATDVTSGAATALTTAWETRTVSWTPSANRAGATFGPAIRTTTATAMTFFIDSVTILQGATVIAHFDGDTPGYGWFGLSGLSMSGSLQSVVRNLETGANYQSVRGSFKVTPPPRKPSWARGSRRYAGARASAEIHDENGSIEWQILVNGASADAAITNVEALLSDIETSQNDLYLEWRPDGATSSVYYEIRGPIEWNGDYEWAQFYGARSLVVTLKAPVAPLAFGASYAIAIPSTTLPNTVQLATAVGGDAPALMDLAFTHGSGSGAAPVWALAGWTRRPASPLGGSLAPVGVIEAELGSLTTWTSTADASYRGGSGAQTTTAGAGTASALYAIDPSVLQPDDFTPGEADIEVWASIRLAATVVTPRLILSLVPTLGAEQFDPVFGSVGKTLVRPSSGTVKRFTRLGVLGLPINTAQPLAYLLKVAASWAIGSSGAFGLDYLVLVPARQRALSPSGKANDATFPRFIPVNTATTKTIRGQDLSGRIASGANNPSRDSGLGGTPLELTPGNADLILKLSSAVPDDPTFDATDEQLAHTVTGSARIWPRYWLGRGS